MRMTAFAGRNLKEMLRDPLTLCFGIGFPVIVLLLLTMIQKNIPGSAEIFELSTLTPGMCVFGLSFVALFSGMLIAKDRSTSFMMRLLTSPLRYGEYILGYLLPLVPMAVAQSLVCIAVAVVLGLKLSVNLLLMLAVLLPCVLVFIGLGLLCGSVMNDKQVGGICGALLTNLSAWMSGAWFDPALVGGTYLKIANALPFYPAVKAARMASLGQYGEIMPNLWIVLVYAVVVLTAAILIFGAKMKTDSK